MAAFEIVGYTGVRRSETDNANPIWVADVVVIAGEGEDEEMHVVPVVASTEDELAYGTDNEIVAMIDGESVTLAHVLIEGMDESQFVGALEGRRRARPKNRSKQRAQNKMLKNQMRKFKNKVTAKQYVGFVAVPAAEAPTQPPTPKAGQRPARWLLKVYVKSGGQMRMQTQWVASKPATLLRKIYKMRNGKKVPVKEVHVKKLTSRDAARYDQMIGQSMHEGAGGGGEPSPPANLTAPGNTQKLAAWVVANAEPFVPSRPESGSVQPGSMTGGILTAGTSVLESLMKRSYADLHESLENAQIKMRESTDPKITRKYQTRIRMINQAIRRKRFGAKPRGMPAEQFRQSNKHLSRFGKKSSPDRVVRDYTDATRSSKKTLPKKPFGKKAATPRA